MAPIEDLDQVVADEEENGSKATAIVEEFAVALEGMVVIEPYEQGAAADPPPHMNKV